MGFFSNKTIQKLTEKLKAIEKKIQNIEDEEERKNLFLKKLHKYDDTLQVNSAIQRKNSTTTVLILAIKLNCPNVAKTILESTNSNLDVKDDEGKTALHHAIAQGDTAITELLIEAMQLGIKDIFSIQYFDTILNGKTEIIEFLINKAVQLGTQNILNTQGSGGITILHYAVSCGKTELIEFLINKAVQLGTQNILSIQDNNGMTALHYAILQKSDIKIIQFLIEKILETGQTDIFGIKDKNGMTLLHHAVHKKNTETTALLIKKILETDRTDIFYIKDNKEKIALDYAIANQDTKIAEILSSVMTRKSNRQRNESGYLSDGDVTDTSIIYNETEKTSLNHSTEEKNANNQQTDSKVENTSPEEGVSDLEPSLERQMENKTYSTENTTPIKEVKPHGENKLNTNIEERRKKENKTDSKNESKGRCKTVMLAALITAVITASLLIYFTSLSALAITVVTCTSSLASGGISAILPTSKLNETKCSNILDGKNPFITQ